MCKGVLSGYLSSLKTSVFSLHLETKFDWHKSTTLMAVDVVGPLAGWLMTLMADSERKRQKKWHHIRFQHSIAPRHRLFNPNMRVNTEERVPIFWHKHMENVIKADSFIWLALTN